jgi:superfamily II DNA or RNA helicase
MPLLPPLGALVRLGDDPTVRIVTKLRPMGAPVDGLVQSGSGQAWHRLEGMRPGYAVGQLVHHLGPRGMGLGTGEVMAIRRLAGFDQVLVQFAETGESRWLDWRLLSYAKPVEERAIKNQTGQHSDHAERTRLRILANALRIWNSNTGAFGRLDIDPLPHQLDVARRVVTSPQARWLIADDVGLGKTIEVGLILHALTQRNRCRRVLVICPSSLTRQWKEEMRGRFGRYFEIYGRDFIPEHVEAMRLRDNVVISLDLAKRPENLAMLVAVGHWDAIVFDEAHRLGKSETGEQTERYALARALRDRAHAFLLLTATPHQGKTRRFAALLELVRPDLESEIATLAMNPEIVGEIIIRNRKSTVTDAEGRLIFRGHDTRRFSVRPSPEMVRANAALLRYLNEGYRASNASKDKTLGRAIGFVMTTYRKLASSSLAAIERALEKRLVRLESGGSSPAAVLSEEDLEDRDDLLDLSPVGSLGAFFDDEAEQVRAVLSQIRAARATDTKSEVFVTQILQPLLQEGQSLLVFTEYRATQDYLRETIAKAMPGVVCRMINGSLGLDEKTDAVRAFNAGEARVMISTEAGGEGLNLQEACHVMVNYDLPWNPSRLVQRIGRLYRYGQTRRVQVLNLQSEDGFDSAALSLMLDRVTTIANEMAAVAADGRDALAADILGELLTNIDMGEILERAQSMKFEQTEAEIAEAIARAQTARQAETDILQYAAASQTQVNGGFEGRHMVSFVRAMAPYAGYTVRQLLHDGKTLEIQLSEKIQRDWPEFGRRSVLRLTVEHVRARRDSSLILMDFESAFIRHLADLASDRWAFDGLYGEARWAFDALLTVHRIRWQDLSGQLLEEDLLPVLSRAGRAQEMDRKEFATLLADPLENRGQVAIGQDRPFDDAEFDRLLVARARPDVMPGSVMTMAGLRLKASEQGDAAQRLPILGR